MSPKSVIIRKICILLFISYGLVFVAPLGFRPLTIPDETRYGEIPREMLVSGDWVSPRLNSLKYFEKPVFGYWMNAVSMMAFGENAFALRIPSALSVLISAFMIFLLVRRFSPRAAAPVLAPAVFLTCPLVFVLGQINLLDNLLSMLLTGAMVCFFFAHMADSMGRKTLFLALAGVFCGLAFLTKGFLAFAVPVLAVTPFLIWEGRYKDLFKIPWIPITTACLTALPWALMIHFREGGFWNYFFWTEHIARFLDPVRGQHPKPFWYFIPVLVGGALPWVVQIPAALSTDFKDQTKNSLMRFAICWLCFPFLFFSFSSGKLIPYILPCVPPLAVIAGMGLSTYFETGKKRYFSIAALSLAVLTALMGLALIFFGLGLFDAVQIYNSGESYKWALGSSGAFLWTFMAIWSTRIKDYRKKLVVYATPVLIFLAIANGFLPNSVIARRTPGKLLTRNVSRVAPNAILISNDNLIRAVCWYYKRADVKILERPGELTYGLDHVDGDEPRFLTVASLKKLASENKGKRPVILILTKDHYDNYAKHLPPPVFTDITDNFVFAVY
ncbi:MAG: phospholipid carrier-dependent glycosyltransferase [Deltaproteobacteria bacterium]|nr:phospholipid carrier-dependent glycosyltransferase [Deltaproteobacteria bacterium]